MMEGEKEESGGGQLIQTDLCQVQFMTVPSAIICLLCYGQE